LAKRDYYEILGVSRDATDADIKKSYRNLALKHHPDRNSGDKHSEEHFKEITEAYSVLSDGEKRGAYDRFGHSGSGNGGPFNGGGFGFGTTFSDVFNDIFTDFMGGGTAGARPQAGEDLLYRLDISFIESAKGTEKEIAITRKITCEDCSGDGIKPGTKPLICGACGGRGNVRHQQGFFSISRTCSTCRGTGRIIKDYCGSCHGSGFEKKAKNIKVSLPAGVNTGNKLRLQGEGNSGYKGGPYGDLYIEVRVEDHEVFSRDGNDILCDIPIPFVLSALGGEIEVPAVDGSASLKIPEGTQNGTVFKFKGKGFPDVYTKRKGDQHVIVNIEVPTHLNSKQKELLREFESITTGKNNPQTKSFMDQLKNFFLCI
jgi:molecular chaperone DnaJ